MELARTDSPFQTPSAVNEAFTAKFNAGMFHPIQRHVTNHPDPDDRFGEGVAVAWDFYRRKAEQDEIVDDALLVHAAKMGAIDYTHRWVGGTGRRRDVMNELCYFLGETEILRLDGIGDDEEGLHKTGNEHGIQNYLDTISFEATRNVEAHLVSGLDLGRWMDEQAENDQTMLAMRQVGHSLAETAGAVGCSVSKTSRRLLDLGLDLAEAAELPVPVKA